ncbi:homocitrate synthase [Candidatus Woesearchaeota archaeon CG_4_10_14_0_8_um_filter_47_5]|nr:MAG: homocitrate synthase [Candidatus Woesearchaeota archaeon CG_4_10_14_0_8_um_filter_47_5]
MKLKPKLKSAGVSAHSACEQKSGQDESNTDSNMEPGFTPEIPEPEILDTTLREGEQTPGVSFTIEQKLEIAKVLDEFGVDIIEAGHPLITPHTSQAVKAIAHEGLKAGILAHCRAQTKDIDAALDCDVSWVGIFFCVSDKSLEERFRKSEEQAIDIITTAVQYAKDHGLKVRYTPEDTVRSAFERVVKVSQAAQKAGVDRISVADTGGVMTPRAMYAYISKLNKHLSVSLNVHCHNDLGMATANSLAALEAGAKLVDVCVNGLGERTGIAPLAEVTTALKVQYRAKNNWKMEILPELSELVEQYSGIPIPRQAPVVGKNAFTHNAGLHVSALLINPYHYETIPCSLVGRKREIVIDKMASKEAVAFKLREFSIDYDDALLCSVFTEIKNRECNWLKDHQFLRLVNEVRNGNTR